MVCRVPVGDVQHTRRAFILLLCLSTLLCLYCTTHLSWLLCPRAESSPHPECLRHIDDTISTFYSATEDAKSQEEDTVSGVETQNSILVLIWTSPFTRPITQASCDLFKITGCHLTDDRGQYDLAHGVMFHHREIRSNWPDLLQLSRPPLQKWVWMNMESPANSLQLPDADNLFNLTSNYRRDSDVWVPYGWIVEVSDGNKDFQLPKKDKLVCWFVNNWDERLLRVKYFNEFSKHIKIETYGGHFHRYHSKQDYFKIISGCKFYLSFENSVYKDYITEKLFNPLTCGTVPVVLGPPRENYEEFVPRDSFIHVDDFRSPQELAEHLKLLDQNQEMYEQYFTWRKHFTAKVSYFGLEHACRICDYLRKNQNYRVFNNLNKWFWG